MPRRDLQETIFMMRQSRVFTFIALCFMIAPVVDLSWSLSGHSLTEVLLIDWVWLGLLFFSGVLLLIRHKTAWFVALMSLLVVIAVNVSLLLEKPSTTSLTPSDEIQVLFSLFLSCCVLILLYYARHPYVDRRQGWFRAAAPRFEIRSPVKVIAEKSYPAWTESLSASGCRVHLRQDWLPVDRARFVDVTFDSLPGIRIKAQVVQVEGSRLRLKFRDFIEGRKGEYLEWLSTQNETSA